MLGIAPVFSCVSTFHVGTNFIPYPNKVSQTIEDAIPSQYFSNILEIAGSGNSKKYINGHWYGSLNFFAPSETYWLSFNNSIEFAFNEPSDIYNDTTSDSRSNTPELFTFNQSIYQAFYFISFLTNFKSSAVLPTNNALVTFCALVTSCRSPSFSMICFLRWSSINFSCVSVMFFSN